MSTSSLPKISVVIPVYNTGEYIGAVLDGDLDMFAEAYLRTGGGHAVSDADLE